MDIASRPHNSTLRFISVEFYKRIYVFAPHFCKQVVHIFRGQIVYLKHRRGKAFCISPCILVSFGFFPTYNGESRQCWLNWQGRLLALSTDHSSITQSIKRCNTTSQWRHNEQDGVTNHRCPDCLLKPLFGRRSRKTSKLRVHWPLWRESTGDHKGPVTRKIFPFDDVIIWFVAAGQQCNQ